MAATVSTKLKRRWRELNFIVKGLLSTDHVLLAHIIPIRRCNLACTYCNEYDAVSPPVPTEVMFQRINRLASFGTATVVISGGEPLMHPELEQIIRHVRSHGIMTGMITNGYLLSPKRIESLNEAGLEYLQISIDNLVPDDVSMKSLKVLDKKLEMLADLAEFSVNINSVIGGGIRNPEDSIKVARRAIELGFSSSTGIIHDSGGHVKPLTEGESRAFDQIKHIGKKGHTRVNWFQNNLARGKPNEWQCRAGGRYLYICEDGLVHYCSQQRGYPAIPIEKYTVDHLRREFYRKKSCAPKCTIGCVQQIAMFDNWRAPQHEVYPGRLPVDGEGFEVGDRWPVVGVEKRLTSDP